MVGHLFVPMGLPGVGEFVTVEFHILLLLMLQCDFLNRGT